MTKTGYNIQNSKSDLRLYNIREIFYFFLPKMSGVLRGNCCETCRNIFQKTPMNGFTKKNSLTRQMLFLNVCSNFLEIK